MMTSGPQPTVTDSNGVDLTRAALIANARSGLRTRKGRLRSLERKLNSAGLHLKTYPVTRRVGPVEAARTAIADGATALIAAGGDGTVSAVASVALEAGVPLGILPAG